MFRTFPDGRTEMLVMPDEGNAAAGQKPEWVPIPGPEQYQGSGNILLNTPGAPNHYENGSPGGPSSPLLPTAPALSGGALLDWLKPK